MDTVLRAFALYIFLAVLLRIAGKRTIADLSTFDFVLLLVIGSAVQQALLSNDFSVTGGFLAAVALVAIDIFVSFVTHRVRVVDRWVNGIPVVLIRRGVVSEENCSRSRVSTEDILEAGRRLHGLKRLDQIEYAVLEKSGGISIVPRTENLASLQKVRIGKKRPA